MLAYVDESGCTGMRFASGASRLYVVTAVVFYDRQVADCCYQTVDELRRSLKVAKEFHFSKLSHPNRLAFFTEAAKFDFEYFAVVFDKHKLGEQGITLTTPFLQYPVKAIFSGIAPKLSEATIVIDEVGSSEFRNGLARELKGEINRQFGREVIKQVKSKASHSHSLLQLADMVCGAVSRSCANSRKNPDEYRSLIKRRERGVAIWPSPSA